MVNHVYRCIPIGQSSLTDTIYTMTEWSGYKTAPFKTATLQNSESYNKTNNKTENATKQRPLQNSDRYKTATVTKLQKMIHSG